MRASSVILRTSVEASEVGVRCGLEAHQTVQMGNENPGIVSSIFSSSVDSALFPIRPIDVITEDAEAKRTSDFLQNGFPIGTIYVGNLNILLFGITPIDFLFFDVKSYSVGPINVIWKEEL